VQQGPYIVFFDWNKSDITPEAATILDNAITQYGNCQTVPIMLAGYTDRSGSPKYNLGLSARRNESVQAYLTSHGIPASSITSQAFGEANPRVPTADGVREPRTVAWKSPTVRVRATSGTARQPGRVTKKRTRDRSNPVPFSLSAS
jgi:outer membrane protein OmpA-like peptidoglycan-associated protein